MEKIYNSFYESLEKENKESTREEFLKYSENALANGKGSASPQQMICLSEKQEVGSRTDKNACNAEGTKFNRVILSC